MLSPRMANGFYVLYSRDPHLAAIGFVWNPLQSVADIVPLLFYHLWPALATRDMSGTIVSSLCMAGATYQLLCAFREWGVPRAPRLVLIALFAINPMVIFYGANGMSEALYLAHSGRRLPLSGSVAAEGWRQFAGLRAGWLSDFAT